MIWTSQTKKVYHKSCTEAAPTTIRYLYLIASEAEQSNDGIAIPILQGDSISHHITGNIGSGVGACDL